MKVLRWLERLGVWLVVAAFWFSVWRVWTAKPKPEPVLPPLPPTVEEGRMLGGMLKAMAQGERVRSWCMDDVGSRQAAWIAAKAEYCLHRTKILDQKVEPDAKTLDAVVSTWRLLHRARALSRMGAQTIPEEPGARMRAYWSPVDHTLQTYSLHLPAALDEETTWPLIVSMHGHGWYAPFQGHPAPEFKGAFSLAPHGRGATDYMALGEDDVLAAIAEVCREHPIDLDRIYLRGSSMGGTGCWHLGTRYADRFAGIQPIVGNADHLAWEARWGWNAPFPGRDDALRGVLQEAQTARAYAGNLLNLPSSVFHGTADTIVPPQHARSMVQELLRHGCPVEYREYPGVGHGGFHGPSLDDGLAWLCARARESAPRRVRWSADLMRHGSAYWLTLEQKRQPLGFATIEAVAGERNQVVVRTSNLAAFSLRRCLDLFDVSRPLFVEVDGERVIFPPAPAETVVRLRYVAGAGWRDAAQAAPEPPMKTAWLEGPIQEALQAPFVLVLGTASQDPVKLAMWKSEVRAFASEWRRRNGAPCRFVRDIDCTAELAATRNLILFGGPEDNSVSAVLQPRLPISEMLLPLLPVGLPGIGAESRSVDLSTPDVGWFMVHPNPEHPHRLVAIVAGNGPEAVYQSWGRFGNWFNWGVHDSMKYFDYAVFDARSASPETFLLLGWFGTDWSVENGWFRLGSAVARSRVEPQVLPRWTEFPKDLAMADLVDLRPAKIDQMRGAVAFGRTFQGEPLPLGIGVRAPAFIEYNLDGSWRSMTTGAVVLNPDGVTLRKARQDGEKVRFIIKGDGRTLASGAASWANPSITLSADLTGVRKLRLEATCEGGPAWLHMGAAWNLPRLYRQ